LNENDFEIVNQLGKGSFGTVYLVKPTKTYKSFSREEEKGNEEKSD
jgi:serine/threonine protein kinase